MIIRLFEERDAGAVSAMIADTLRITNGKDYPPEYIEGTVSHMQPADIVRRASWTHYYVIEEAGDILGCGAIGPYWGSDTESSLFNIFIHPHHQGKGLGRKLMEAVEGDAYALRAKRIEIPASITALGFYQKMGYQLKPGVTAPDEEGIYRMEKFR